MEQPELRDKLKTLLNREPSCSKLADGRFIADYFQYGVPATKFTGKSEDEALSGLLEFLQTKLNKQDQ